MLKIEFKECCRNCNHVKVKDSSYEGRSIERGAVVMARIYCDHAVVCKTFMESDEPWQGRNQT